MILAIFGLQQVEIRGSIDLTITEELDGSVDVVFSALPHGVSAERLSPLIESGVKVGDISADFRLRDPGDYQRPGFG